MLGNNETWFFIIIIDKKMVIPVALNTEVTTRYKLVNSLPKYDNEGVMKSYYKLLGFRDMSFSVFSKRSA